MTSRICPLRFVQDSVIIGRAEFAGPLEKPGARLHAGACHDRINRSTAALRACERPIRHLRAVQRLWAPRREVPHSGWLASAELVPSIRDLQRSRCVRQPARSRDTDATGVVLRSPIGSPKIAGAVRNGAGTSEPGASVIVFPSDSQTWSSMWLNPRRFRRVQSRANRCLQDFSAASRQLFRRCRPGRAHGRLAGPVISRCAQPRRVAGIGR